MNHYQIIETGNIVVWESVYEQYHKCFCTNSAKYSFYRDKHSQVIDKWHRTGFYDWLAQQTYTLELKSVYELRSNVLSNH